MNKPTLAQIEAVAKILNVSYQNKAYSMKIAEVVLAAAAQVGEQGSDKIVWPEKEVKRIKPRVAQVGEPKDWIEKRKAIRQSAIERCAQVVDGYDGYISAPSPKTISAAIRKLKDAP